MPGMNFIARIVEYLRVRFTGKQPKPGLFPPIQWTITVIGGGGGGGHDDGHDDGGGATSDPSRGIVVGPGEGGSVTVGLPGNGGFLTIASSEEQTTDHSQAARRPGRAGARAKFVKATGKANGKR